MVHHQLNEKQREETFQIQSTVVTRGIHNNIQPSSFTTTMPHPLQPTPLLPVKVLLVVVPPKRHLNNNQQQQKPFTTSNNSTTNSSSCQRTFVPTTTMTTTMMVRTTPLCALRNHNRTTCSSVTNDGDGRCRDDDDTRHNTSTLQRNSNRIPIQMTAMVVVLAVFLVCLSLLSSSVSVSAMIPDRHRLIQHRYTNGQISSLHDNGYALDGQLYRKQQKSRSQLFQDIDTQLQQQQPRLRDDEQLKKKQQEQQQQPLPRNRNLRFTSNNNNQTKTLQNHRQLSSQLSGCCYNYKSYSASTLCALYGNDCESGSTKSHDSGDSSCTGDGLSFIGLSFSVNTASGNPYSYQLCDQFPMENIIDRDYEYVMSMDEDGWLVGGGYKTFDYSGKMPYIDSSHTELLRIGNIDPNKGGTSIETVYAAMSSISFAPFSIYPEYVKGGGGHHSGDDGSGSSGVSASDITMIVSIVETYEDSSSYSSYEQFLDDLFDALDAVGGGPCMDDHDTDPHVSMARGVKFWSSYHQQQYLYAANLEIAVWQSMYPKGVPIGSAGYAAFPPGRNGRKQAVGYGNLYFFFDRANITKAFAPYRSLTSSESYYSTLYSSGDTSSYYASTTSISFNYGGSNDKNSDNSNWEWNPYSWNQKSAKHDMTTGWELPPSCSQEGETFFGIPLSRTSGSKLQSSMTFQEQFDFEYLVDRNGTYVSSFGTNHGWLVGEQIGNSVGSIVDKDTAHIPIFYTGSTNPNMGGISLGDLIKIAKKIDFGTLYIKPAFVFVDSDGHVKLQFEVDTTSALAYLYDSLCKQLGISWNSYSPSNSLGVYSHCAMHSAGDRAAYGCGPEGTGSGGFCPQMTLAYSPRFSSEDLAAAYMYRCNNYVDYWRSLYPSGVAVGTSNFCASGGCLGLFLNRQDLYEVFKPDLGGAWVEYNGASMPPTYSPAPTWKGGCDDPHNFFLDKCVRKRYKPKPTAVAWDALGYVGQVSVMLVVAMAVTLSVSIFLARARKKRRRGESYIGFFFRDLTRKRKPKRPRRKGGRSGGNGGLEEKMISDGVNGGVAGGGSSSRRSRSAGRRSTTRSQSRTKSGTAATSNSRRSKSSGRTSSRSRTTSGTTGGKVTSTSGGGSNNNNIGGNNTSTTPHTSMDSTTASDSMMKDGTTSITTAMNTSNNNNMIHTTIGGIPDESKDNRQQLV